MSEIKMGLGMKEETFLFIPMYITGPRGSKVWRSWRLRVYMEAAWPEGRRVWQGFPWLGWGSDCTPPTSRTDPLPTSSLTALWDTLGVQMAGETSPPHHALPGLLSPGQLRAHVCYPPGDSPRSWSPSFSTEKWGPRQEAEHTEGSVVCMF